MLNTNPTTSDNEKKDVLAELRAKAKAKTEEEKAKEEKERIEINKKFNETLIIVVLVIIAVFIVYALTSFSGCISILFTGKGFGA